MNAWMNDVVMQEGPHAAVGAVSINSKSSRLPAPRSTPAEDGGNI